MLHIIDQYKQLFSSFILSSLNNKVESTGSNAGNLDSSLSFKDALTKALDSGSLNKEEATDLLTRLEGDRNEELRYTRDSAKILVNSLGVKGTETWINKNSLKSKLREISSQLKIVNENNLLDESILEKASFKRTLKKGVSKGDDVKILQKYLISKGLLNSTYKTRSGKIKSSIDGNFGNGTKNALKKVQETIYGKGNKFVDGEMTKGGKTMDYITNDINNELTHDQKDIKYGKKANEMVDHLTTTEKYLTAFNKVYGGTEHLISRHNGLLGIIHRLGGSDLDNLVQELEDNGLNLDNLDDDKKTKLAEELGIDKNSDKFTDGLIRTAAIAAISAILTGGSSVALELFAINYGENLSKGPEISKIIKQLDKKNVSDGLRKEMMNMLIAKDTTVEGLEAILDHLNNENMDPATMMRLINDIYDPNWFQSTFGIFMPYGYEDVEDLVVKFKKSNNLKDAKEIVAKIYTLSYKGFSKATKHRIKEENDFNELKTKYEEFIKKPAYILDSDYNKLNSVYTSSKYSYKNAIKDEKKAIDGFSKLGNIISRYTNMKAKNDYIEGNKFDIKKARKRESRIDEELSITDLKPISEKLYSEQSFGYSVDVNKLDDSKYMSELITKMKSETINGKTSVISGIIRGIEQHYFGYTETFSAEDFVYSFKNTAEKTTSKYILSNLGRDRNQKFQGEITGNLFKIEINGKEVFFRDKCTNIITVVNPIETTVKDTNSVPIVWTFDTGADNAGNGNSVNPQHNGTGGTTSMPIDGEPIDVLKLPNQQLM